MLLRVYFMFGGFCVIMVCKVFDGLRLLAVLVGGLLICGSWDCWVFLCVRFLVALVFCIILMCYCIL